MVMFLHGGAMPEFMTCFPYWSNRVLQRANLIIAPSKYLAREVQKRGFPAQIIPNVVRNISELPYKPRRDIKPNLLWMRSFDSIYRPEMAVKVLSKLKLENENATLVMAGQDIGLQKTTMQLAEHLGLKDVTHFPGFFGFGRKNS